MELPWLYEEHKDESQPLFNFISDSPKHDKLHVVPKPRSSLEEQDTNSRQDDKGPKPSANRREQNKLYAKLNRRRKKEYTVHLEKKVEVLEAEIVNLNMKVKHLQIKLQKDAIRDDKVLGDYLEADEYL